MRSSLNLEVVFRAAASDRLPPSPPDPRLTRYLEDLQANNPGEYEQLIVQMQAEMDRKGIGGGAPQGESICVVPEPGFVAKTRSVTNKGRKVFINLCTSEHVDKCGEVPAGEDGGEAQVRIPLSLGPPHEDLDKDGTVSKKEFRRAMPALGFDIPVKEIDALFDANDPDRSGKMEFKELKQMLKPHRGPKGGAASAVNTAVNVSAAAAAFKKKGAGAGSSPDAVAKGAARKKS